MDLRVTLPADPRSPAEARRLVRRFTRERALAEVLDAAELLVTELVTNAVLHARTDVVLVLRAPGGGLRVEVCDGSPTPPALRHYGPTAATGRGIRLLDSIAQHWGVAPLGTGKCVWFTLAAGSAEPPAAAWQQFDLEAVDPI